MISKFANNMVPKFCKCNFCNKIIEVFPTKSTNQHGVNYYEYNLPNGWAWIEYNKKICPDCRNIKDIIE